MITEGRGGPIDVRANGPRYRDGKTGPHHRFGDGQCWFVKYFCPMVDTDLGLAAAI